MDDYFLEIARIDKNQLIINRNTIREVLCTPDTAKRDVAIHVVIGPHNSKKTTILGQLADFYLESWKSLNLQHIAFNSEKMSKLFPDTRNNDRNEKQLVICRHPLLALRNDGSKVKVAHFFMDIWGNSDDDKNYVVLAGIAAMLSSSLIFISEGDIMTKETEWLTRMLSVTFKMSKSPRKLQNMFFVLKSWTPASGVLIGKPLAEEYVTKLEITSNGEKIPILKTISENLEVFLVPKDTDETFDGLKYFRSIYRTILDRDLMKTENQNAVTGDYICGMLKNVPLLEELIEFHNFPFLEELLEELKVSKNGELVDDGPEYFGEDNFQNNDFEQQEDLEKTALPWAPKDDKNSNVPPLVGLSFNSGNKAHVVSFAEFLKKQEGHLAEPPISTLQKDYVGANCNFLLSEADVSENVDVKSIIEKSFKDTCHPFKSKRSTTMQCFGLSASECPTDNLENNFSTAYEMSTNYFQFDSPKEKLDDQENKEYLEQILLKNTAEQFLKAEVNSKISGKIIFDDAVRVSMLNLPYGINHLKKYVSNFEDTQQQLAIAMNEVVSYQKEMIEAIKPVIFYECFEEFQSFSKSKRHHKERNGALLKNFQMALVAKLDTLEKRYWELNVNIHKKQNVILGMFAKELEVKFRSLIASSQEKQPQLVEKFLNLATGILQNIYKGQLPPNCNDVVKNLRLKLIQMQDHIVQDSSIYPSLYQDIQASSATTALESGHKRSVMTQEAIEAMDWEISLTQSKEMGNKSSRISKSSAPLQLLINQKMDIPNYPTDSISSHSNNTPQQNFSYPLPESNTKLTACIVFEWDNITAFVESNGIPRIIYGPQPNKISYNNSEILIGNDCVSTDHKDIKEISNYFLSSKSPTFEPKNLITILALILLKVNGLVCKTLGHQPSMLLVLPSFACPHLAAVFVAAIEVSGLEILTVDKDVCNLAIEASNYSSLKNVVVLQDHCTQHYATATLFRINKSFVAIAAVEHAWDTYSLFSFNFKISNYAQANALQKIRNSKDSKLGIVDKVIFNCIPSRKKYVLAEIKRNFFNAGEGFVEDSIISGACKLAIALSTSSSKNNKQMKLLLNYCAFEKKIVLMSHSSCKHKGFDLSSQSDNSINVHKVVKADADAVETCMKSTKSILFDKLNNCSELQRNEIIKVIREVEGLGSVSTIKKLLNSILEKS